ncbi:hypothetical protein [Campylobacter majalis]|uniref:hypothetical protein n=1 Tax=Campylobacter majalis TaxID=2790656 RepID=UPI003D69EDD2
MIFKIKNFIIFILFALLLTACTGINHARIINDINIKSAQKHSPYKLELVKEDEKAVFYQEVPAGKYKGRSYALNDFILYNDIFKTIASCGFTQDDLLQVRILDYDEKNLRVEEIWVFKDEKSERSDKLTAFYVILQANTQIGGTDINIKSPNGCHAPKELTFVFGK